MSTPSKITIDGPAASGKSTLGKNLAEALGYLFFDTGVMYRVMTWRAMQLRLDIKDQAAIAALAEKIAIDVRPPSHKDGRAYDVWVDGEDVTWEIRSAEIDANVSPVSAYPGVRQALTLLQRVIGQRGKVVMVGRDIGTVVLPEAELKIYLEASVEERARRRYAEMSARGEPAVYDAILESLRERDRIDSTRQVAPLRPAKDAVILDSDGLSASDVLERIKALVWSRRA